MLKYIFSFFTFLILLNCQAQDLDNTYSKYASIYNELISQNKFKEAQIIAFETVKLLKEKSPNDPRVAVGYKGVGFTYNKLKQYDSAVFYYKISLHTFLNHFGKENYNTATTRSLLGEAYYNQNLFQEAKKECLDAYNTFKNLSSKKDEFIIDNYFLLFKIFHKLQEPAISYHFLSFAINTARIEYNDPYKDLPLFYKEFGIWHLESNNYELAEECFNTSIMYADKLKEENIIIADNYYLAEIKRRIGDNNSFKNYIHKGLEKNNITSFPTDIKEINQMNLYSLLGIYCSKQNKIDSALYFFDAIEKIAKQHSNTNEFPGIKEYYFEYGKALSIKENWNKAKTSFQHSLLLFENNSSFLNDKLKADNLIQLSNIYKITGPADSSIYYFEKANSTLNISDINPYLELLSQVRKSDSLSYNKKYDEAINLLKKLIKTTPTIFPKNDSRVGHLYFKVGEAYAKQKKYSKAIENTWKAYHIYELEHNNRNANCTKALNELLEDYFQISNFKEYEKVKSLRKSFEYYE